MLGIFVLFQTANFPSSSRDLRGENLLWLKNADLKIARYNGGVAKHGDAFFQFKFFISTTSV